MCYKKLSLSQIAYTEEDRLSLFSVYKDMKQLGYGQYYLIQDNSPDYIQRLRDSMPIFDGSYSIHRTTDNSNQLARIHTDNRPAGLNIPINDCGAGCDTVFYNPSTLTRIIIPNPSMSDSYLSNNPIEECRFTLTMDSAYLLNTHYPHARVQTSSNDRLFLSMNLCVTYEEALEYFH